MVTPLTDAERTTLASHCSTIGASTTAQRRRGYALAYRRFRTERYCTRPYPRLWRVSAAVAREIERKIDHPTTA